MKPIKIILKYTNNRVVNIHNIIEIQLHTHITVNQYVFNKDMEDFIKYNIESTIYDKILYDMKNPRHNFESFNNIVIVNINYNTPYFGIFLNASMFYLFWILPMWLDPFISYLQKIIASSLQSLVIMLLFFVDMK